VATGKKYIALKSLLVGPKDALYKKKEDIVVEETFLGATLAGKTYVPIFNYYPELVERAYRVVVDTLVAACVYSRRH
jgi:hypothetical protein